MNQRIDQHSDHEAKLRDYIDRVVASAPPLSTAQKDKLAGLLRIAGK